MLILTRLSSYVTHVTNVTAYLFDFLCIYMHLKRSIFRFKKQLDIGFYVTITEDYIASLSLREPSMEGGVCKDMIWEFPNSLLEYFTSWNNRDYD